MKFTRKLDDQSISFAWNGYQYNIAEGVADFCISRGLFVRTLQSPYSYKPFPYRTLRLSRFSTLKVQKRRILVRPFLSYLFDVLFDTVNGSSRVFVGFGCHHTLAGLILKKLGRVKVVVHWNIDFTPERFTNRTWNFLYNWADKFALMKSDFQVDITLKAQESRFKLYRLQKSDRAMVVPHGINKHQILKVNDDSFFAKRIVFLGNLSEHQGVQNVILAMPMIRKEIPNATLNIIGDGPYAQDLQILVRKLKLDDSVNFTGYLSEEAISAFLTNSTLGVAPYIIESKSYSNFADPGKIKLYLRHGLPIVTTNVAPIAEDIEGRKCGLIVDDIAAEVGQAIINIMNSKFMWDEMSTNSHKYAKSLTWDVCLFEILEKLEINDLSMT
jgi:glycosyltransferase involved in cell wall biosynthesis